MAILIEGMEMPKDGVYWCEIGVADDIAMITIHGEDRKSFPLVPVPPHGRLGDLNAVIDLVMQYCPDDDGVCSKAGADLRELLDEIENMPTVIPASEEKG